jgi:hypothetical protein
MLFLLFVLRSVENMLNTCLRESDIYCTKSPMIDQWPGDKFEGSITHNTDLPSNPMTQNQNMPLLTVLIKWIMLMHKKV